MNLDTVVNIAGGAVVAAAGWVLLNHAPLPLKVASLEARQEKSETAQGQIKETLDRMAGQVEFLVDMAKRRK